MDKIYEKFKGKLWIKYDGNLANLINKVEKVLIERNLNLIELVIDDIGSRIEMEQVIRLGFVPALIFSKYEREMLDADSLIAYFVEGLNDDEIAFWMPDNEIDPILKSLSRRGEFVYANLQGWKGLSLKTSISFPLILYAKELLYNSMRPRTDMLMFRQVTSLKYKEAKKVGPYYYLLDDEKLAVPVTRYASGMSKGLYYSEEDATPSTFCGTFYYYEPQSTTFLVFETARVYRNKHSAMKDLNPSGVSEFTNRTADFYYNDKLKLPYDLMMTPIEYMEFRDPAGLEEYENENPNFRKEVGTRKHYVAHKLGLYAAEDHYDQDLCREAAANEIDILILTHMVGSYKLVIEVLDSRDRMLSFSQLAYPVSK